MLHGVGGEESAADRRSEFVVPKEYVPHIRINWGII